MNSPEIVAVSLFNASLFGLFSKEDWSRMTGPVSGLVVSILIMVVLFKHSANRIRKDDERARLDRQDREERHKEAMQVQRDLMKKLEDKDERLMALTVEQMKAQGHATNAINSMDRNIQRLTIQLADMPCKKAS